MNREAETVFLERVARLRHGVQHAKHPAGNGLVVLRLGKRPAHFHGVFHRETPIDQPCVGAFLLDDGTLAIRFVHDFAHDFLNDVLNGN